MNISDLTSPDAPDAPDADESPGGPGPTAGNRWFERVVGLQPLLVALVVMGIGLLWVGTNAFRQDLAILAATYALIALGMYVPFVMAGSLSLAYSAYAGIGAYAVAIVSTDTDLPLWVGWIAGSLVSAVVAAILGLATRRLSGFFLAAVTLLFGTAFETWLVDADGITGGSGGIGGLRDLELFGWVPSRGAQVTAAALLVVVVTFLLDRLRQSPWGILVRTTSEVPIVAESSGSRVPWLVIVSLSFGAMIASLGGSLFATFVGGVTSETFTLHIVFFAIFMPLIGGMGTAWGAVVGALVVVELTLNFPAVSESGRLILAVGVLLILLVAPRGLLGYLDTGRKQILRTFGGAGRG